MNFNQMLPELDMPRSDQEQQAKLAILLEIVKLCIHWDNGFHVELTQEYPFKDGVVRRFLFSAEACGNVNGEYRARSWCDLLKALNDPNAGEGYDYKLKWEDCHTTQPDRHTVEQVLELS